MPQSPTPTGTSWYLVRLKESLSFSHTSQDIIMFLLGWTDWLYDMCNMSPNMCCLCMVYQIQRHIDLMEAKGLVSMWTQRHSEPNTMWWCHLYWCDVAMGSQDSELQH
ncbi:hypothetical protein EDD15DRAFT_2203836 [Pisolithus albus]|nr:hypothetical protein EDD15DRAFT_2203836 [Pisolithus albus]